MPLVERPRLLAPWLRRGLEAGLVGGVLASATVMAFHFSRPAPRIVLPEGIDGALIMLPAVLSLAVLVVGYPTFLAATRADALLGVAAAFLVAVDILLAVSIFMDERIIFHPINRWLPLGFVGAIWALPVAAIGLVIGQTTSPLGFGRSAAFRSAATSMVLTIIAVLAAAKFS